MGKQIIVTQNNILFYIIIGLLLILLLGIYLLYATFNSAQRDIKTDLSHIKHVQQFIDKTIDDTMDKIVTKESEELDTIDDTMDKIVMDKIVTKDSEELDTIDEESD